MEQKNDLALMQIILDFIEEYQIDSVRKYQQKLKEHPKEVPSVWCIQERFGSWDKLLIQLGENRNERYCWSKMSDKDLEEIVRDFINSIAEKLCATLSFGVDNSRAKDFYDLYTILKFETIDEHSLYKSVRNTFTQRGDRDKLATYYDRSIDSIANSPELKKRWEKYQGDNIFAKDISYVDSIKQIMKSCIEQEGLGINRDR